MYSVDGNFPEKLFVYNIEDIKNPIQLPTVEFGPDHWATGNKINFIGANDKYIKLTKFVIDY